MDTVHKCPRMLLLGTMHMHKGLPQLLVCRLLLS